MLDFFQKITPRVSKWIESGIAAQGNLCNWRKIRSTDLEDWTIPLFQPRVDPGLIQKKVLLVGSRFSLCVSLPMYKARTSKSSRNGKIKHCTRHFLKSCWSPNRPLTSQAYILCPYSDHTLFVEVFARTNICAFLRRTWICAELREN